MAKLPFKAAAITHLTDARYFAAEGARWLGFSAPLPQEAGASEVYVRLREILAWIEGPEPILELAKAPTPDQLEEIVLSSGFRQLQWPVAFGVCKEPSLPPDVSWWPLLQFKPEQLEEASEQVEECSAFAKYVVLSCRGFLSESQCAKLAHGLQNQSLILDFDWTPGLLQQVVRQWDVAGVQFCGSAEEKPGMKSFEELEPLLEILNSAY